MNKAENEDPLYYPSQQAGFLGINNPEPSKQLGGAHKVIAIDIFDFANFWAKKIWAKFLKVSLYLDYGAQFQNQVVHYL